MNERPSLFDADFPFWDETGCCLYFLGSEWDVDLAFARPLELNELRQLAGEALQALGQMLWRRARHP